MGCTSCEGVLVVFTPSTLGPTSASQGDGVLHELISPDRMEHAKSAFIPL